MKFDNFLLALGAMGKGMLGIFVVIGVIVGVMVLLSKIPDVGEKK